MAPHSKYDAHGETGNYFEAKDRLMRPSSKKSFTKLIFQCSLLTGLVMSSTLASISLSYAGIKAGSRCSESQFNNDAQVKSGKVTYLCTGAESGYFWEPVGSGGSSGNVSNTPAKSAYYSRGFNAIKNATQDGLVSYGYYRYLNSQNLMTYTNAIRWCAYVSQTIQLRTNAMEGWTLKNVSDWKSGCVSAAMGFAN